MGKVRKSLAGLTLGLALAAMPAGAAFAAGGNSSFWVTPVIKGYGAMHPLPHAALQPNPAKVYKIVFDAKSGGVKDGVNTALWHVARAVNLYGASGVDKAHRKFAVVIHGPATPLVMTNAAYKKRFGKDNPNLKLIDELTDAGVKIYVCGQAAGDLKIPYNDINPHIILTLSALADLPILQSQGYSLFPM